VVVVGPRDAELCDVCTVPQGVTSQLGAQSCGVCGVVSGARGGACCWSPPWGSATSAQSLRERMVPLGLLLLCVPSAFRTHLTFIPCPSHCPPWFHGPWLCGSLNEDAIDLECRETVRRGYGGFPAEAALQPAEFAPTLAAGSGGGLERFGMGAARTHDAGDHASAAHRVGDRQYVQPRAPTPTAGTEPIPTRPYIGVGHKRRAHGASHGASG
jgi:hypothetical protein